LVAYDGLVIAVNPANDWVKEISISELKKIWEPEAQGKIKTWNQIRSEWPNKEIHLYGPGVESGTYDYFTEAIIGKSHTSRGDYTGSEDDNILVQGVSGDKLALGFFGFAFYQENKSKLKIIPVNNDKANKGKGAIEPSIESIMNRTYAPLSRPLYLYVNSKETQRKEIVSFVEFYLKHATSLSKSVGFVPLREEEYKTQLEHFSSFVKQGR
jgi:phosphate transport system substrate-binding protein